MLVCTKCGFTADDSSEEWGQLKNRLYANEEVVMEETSIYCRECGCDEVVEAEQCEHCGEWFDPDTLILFTQELPPDDEYPEGSEDTIRVCSSCCDELTEEREAKDDIQ